MLKIKSRNRSWMSHRKKTVLEGTSFPRRREAVIAAISPPEAALEARLWTALGCCSGEIANASCWCFLQKVRAGEQGCNKNPRAPAVRCNREPKRIDQSLRVLYPRVSQKWQTQHTDEEQIQSKGGVVISNGEQHQVPPVHCCAPSQREWKITVPRVHSTPSLHHTRHVSMLCPSPQAGIHPR